MGTDMILPDGHSPGHTGCGAPATSATGGGAVVKAGRATSGRGSKLAIVAHRYLANGVPSPRVEISAMFG
jgi:hypothetical protein